MNCKEFFGEKRKMMGMWFLCMLFSSGLSAQSILEETGLLSNSRNETAHEATEHWGQLVGNWDIVVEMLDTTGKVQQSFDGEWNWFYVMNGMAVQDVFILPKRKDINQGANAFYGVGLRIYNEKTQKWQTVYMDTSKREIDTGEATSTNEEITLFEKSSDDEKVRITYYDLQENTFKWRQEVYNEEKQTWLTTQVIHATRKS